MAAIVTSGASRGRIVSSRADAAVSAEPFRAEVAKDGAGRPRPEHHRAPAAVARADRGRNGAAEDPTVDEPSDTEDGLSAMLPLALWRPSAIGAAGGLHDLGSATSSPFQRGHLLAVIDTLSHGPQTVAAASAQALLTEIVRLTDFIAERRQSVPIVPRRKRPTAAGPAATPAVPPGAQT